MDWPILRWFGLLWIGLGRFGLFRGRTARSRQTEPSAQRPPTPRHHDDLGAHWPAPPSAHASLLVIGQLFSQSFTFRCSDSLRWVGGGTPVPLGDRRGAGQGARCVLPCGLPRNIPGGIPCRHGALLPGAENHPPGEGSGENRRSGRWRVGVARRGCASRLPCQRGAGRSAHARGLCHGGGNEAEYGGQEQAWIAHSPFLNGSGAIGTAKEEYPYSFLHSLLFQKATAVVPHSW